MEVKKSDTGAIVEAEGSDHGDGEHGHGGHGDGDHEHEEGEHEHEEGEHHGDGDDDDVEINGTDAVLLTFLATIIATVCSLVGIVFFIPCFRRWFRNPDNLLDFQIFSSAFTAGAIIGSLGFITLPEAMVSIASSFETEAASNVVLGYSLLS